MKTQISSDAVKMWRLFLRVSQFGDATLTSLDVISLIERLEAVQGKK